MCVCGVPLTCDGGAKHQWDPPIPLKEGWRGDLPAIDYAHPDYPLKRKCNVCQAEVEEEWCAVKGIACIRVKKTVVGYWTSIRASDAQEVGVQVTETLREAERLATLQRISMHPDRLRRRTS